MIKFVSKFLLCLLFSLPVFAQDFSSYQKILNECVKEKSLPDGGFESSFNYEKLIKNKDLMNELKIQQTKLADFNLAELKNRNSEISFWINVYNFLMISKIVKDGTKNEELKVTSVKDIGTTLNPYRAFTDKDFKVAGALRTLDEVEKDILLKKIKDPRIHFAVNCASVGCPPLRKKTYTEQNVDQMLNENLARAFNTKRHVEISGSILKLTSIFKWYGKDFDSNSDVKKFIISHTKDEKLIQLINATKTIEFTDYNWKLNKPENF